jgi:hypothetical protein
MNKIFLLLLVVLVSFEGVFATSMTSSNYSIQIDSVNFGGGFGSSTNYVGESTFGEVATGPSSSTSYTINAGYQQMDATYLAISTVSDVTLSPSISASGGGTANGSTSVTVTTDNPTGYELYIKATSSPALVSGANFFSDYVPAGANPDFSFTVGAATSEFGFTPEGSDVVQKYLDNGSVCNTGLTDTTDSCWNGLSTSNELIATKTSDNYPSGSATTLKFRAESGASNTQGAGSYTATTTVTAVAI